MADLKPAEAMANLFPPGKASTPVADHLAVSNGSAIGSVFHDAWQSAENYILTRKSLGSFAEKQFDADVEHNYSTLGMRLLLEGDLPEEDILKAEGMRKTLSVNPFVSESTSESVAGFSAGVYDFGVNKMGPAQAVGLATGAAGAAIGGPPGAVAGYKLGVSVGLPYMFSRAAAGKWMMDSYLDASRVGREGELGDLRGSAAIQQAAYFLMFFGGLKPLGKFLGNAFTKAGGAKALSGAMANQLQKVGTGPLGRLLAGSAIGTGVLSYFSAGSAVIDDMANAAAHEILHGKPENAGEAAISRLLPQAVDPKTGRVLEEFEDDKDAKTRVPALTAASDAVIDNFASNTAFAGTLGLFSAGWGILKQNLKRASVRRALNTMVSSEDMTRMREFTEQLKGIGAKPEQIEKSVNDMLSSAPHEARVMHVPIDRWADHFSRSAEFNYDPVAAIERYLDVGREKAESLMARPELEVPVGKFMGRGLAGKDADFFTNWARNNVRAESIGEVMERKGEEPNAKPLAEAIEIDAEPPPAPPKAPPKRAIVNELDAGLEIPLNDKIEKLVSKKNAEKVKRGAEKVEKAKEDWRKNQQIRQMAEQAKAIESEINTATRDILEVKDSEPVPAAWSLIANGELPSGKKAAKGPIAKIDRASIERLMGKEWSDKNIPVELTGKKPSVSLTADEMSTLFGFPDTKGFIRGLAKTGDPRESARSVAEGTIVQGRGFESAAEAAMDGWDFQTKLNATRFNKTMYDSLADAEIRQAKRALDVEAPRIPRRMDLAELQRERAKVYEDVTLDEIKGLKYKEVLSQNRHANRVAEANANNDVSSMLDALESQTRAQMGQKHLAELKVSGGKSRDFLKKQSRKKEVQTRGKADTRLSNLANEVLDRVGLRENLSELSDINKEIAEIATESGIPLEAPKLFNKGRFRDVKDVPVNDLIEASDFVKQLNHVAKGINEINSMGRKITMQEFVDNFAKNAKEKLGVELPRTENGGIAREPQLTGPEAEGISKAAKRFSQIAGQEARIVQFILETMDGGDPNGLMSNTIRADVVDGLSRASGKTQEMIGDFAKVFEPLKGKSAKDRMTTTSGREFTLEERVLITGLRGSAHGELTAKEILGLSDVDLREITDSLTKRQLDIATKETYAVYDKHWETIAKAELENSGLEPPRAETKPFLTKHGWVDGGFVPIKYTNVVSKKGQISTATVLDNQFPARQMTKPGHLRARTAPPVAGKIRLDLGVHTSYASEMMHDAFTRGPLANASRILHNESIVHGLERLGGPELVSNLHNWIKTTAVNRIPMPRGGFIESLAMKGINGISATSIPLNPRAAATQISGLPVAARDIGMRPIYREVANVVRMVHEEGDFGKLLSRIQETHVEEPRMAERVQGKADLAIAELQRQISDVDPREWQDKPYMLNPKFLDSGIRSYKWFTGYMQGLMDYVIYTAAKNEALAGKFKNIDPTDADAVRRFAFDRVERSQGSGEVEFLSPAQRKGTVATRLVTQFSTPLWAMLNMKMSMAIDNINRGKSGRFGEISKKDLPRNIGLIMASLFGSSMIYSAIHGDLDGWFDVLVGTAEEAPFFGEVAGSIRHAIKTGGRTDFDTPIGQWVNNMTSYFDDLLKQSRKENSKKKRRKKDKPITGRQIKKALRTVSVIPGVPITIFANPISIFWDVTQGNINKDMSGSEVFLRSVFTGATRETERER